MNSTTRTTLTNQKSINQANIKKDSLEESNLSLASKANANKQSQFSPASSLSQSLQSENNGTLNQNQQNSSSNNNNSKDSSNNNDQISTNGTTQNTSNNQMSRYNNYNSPYGNSYGGGYGGYGGYGGGMYGGGMYGGGGGMYGGGMYGQQNGQQNNMQQPGFRGEYQGVLNGLQSMLSISYGGIMLAGYGQFLLKMSKDIIGFLGSKSKNLIFMLMGIKYWRRLLRWIASGEAGQEIAHGLKEVKNKSLDRSLISNTAHRLLTVFRFLAVICIAGAIYQRNTVQKKLNHIQAQQKEQQRLELQKKKEESLKILKQQQRKQEIEDNLRAISDQFSTEFNSHGHDHDIDASDSEDIIMDDLTVSSQNNSRKNSKDIVEEDEEDDIKEKIDLDSQNSGEIPLFMEDDDDDFDDDMASELNLTQESITEVKIQISPLQDQIKKENEQKKSAQNGSNSVLGNILDRSEEWNFGQQNTNQENLEEVKTSSDIKVEQNQQESEIQKQTENQSSDISGSMNLINHKLFMTKHQSSFGSLGNSDSTAEKPAAKKPWLSRKKPTLPAVDLSGLQNNNNNSLPSNSLIYPKDIKIKQQQQIQSQDDQKQDQIQE